MTEVLGTAVESDHASAVARELGATVQQVRAASELLARGGIIRSLPLSTLIRWPGDSVLMGPVDSREGPSGVVPEGSH